MTMADVGIVDPTAAWDALSTEENAMMIDVRTQAEWTFVGLPDLGSIGKQAALIEWQSYPTMVMNEAFADSALQVANDVEADSIYFLCRSGARSLHAAINTLTVAIARGRTLACFNIAEGFEGDPNHEARRGTINGWKARGLPWRQS